MDFRVGYIMNLYRYISYRLKDLRMCGGCTLYQRISLSIRSPRPRYIPVRNALLTSTYAFDSRHSQETWTRDHTSSNHQVSVPSICLHSDLKPNLQYLWPPARIALDDAPQAVSSALISGNWRLAALRVPSGLVLKTNLVPGEVLTIVLTSRSNRGVNSGVLRIPNPLRGYQLYIVLPDPHKKCHWHANTIILLDLQLLFQFRHGFFSIICHNIISQS